MSCERQPPHSYEAIQATIESLWHSLPPEQQLSLTLTLIATLMNGESSHQLQSQLVQWPLAADQLPETWPHIVLTETSLAHHLHLSPTEAAQFDPDTLTHIAQAVRYHFLHDWFWHEVKTHLFDSEQTLPGSALRPTQT